MYVQSLCHQHSLSSFSDRDRVSGPSDSGSRSTSGDTGEGELRTWPIEVRDNNEVYARRYCLQSHYYVTHNQ